MESDIRFTLIRDTAENVPLRNLPPTLVQLLEQDRLLSISQVAAVLGIPLYTAREWARRGVIPTIKLGRRVFVRAGSFHRWLKEHEHGG